MGPSVTQEGFKRKLTAILSADVAGLVSILTGVSTIVRFL